MTAQRRQSQRHVLLVRLLIACAAVKTRAMSETIDDITASKQKLQFSAEYSVLFAPFLREILSRTPKSAFKMSENHDPSKNPLDDFLNEQKVQIIKLKVSLLMC